MKLEILKEDKNKLSFLLKDSNAAYANALRRIMLNEVPVMAIEEVEFKKNSSALYDEIIAHRLGLIPLTTDLESYELPQSEEDIKERKAKSTLTLTLSVKGPKTVYASDLVSSDPKVKPVYDKIPIVKLLKDQELELSAIAILGKGKDHAKFSGCHVWYNYNPNLKINNKHKDLNKFKEMFPPEIFNKKGEIDETLILEKNLVDAVANVNDEIIHVDYNDKEFIFYIESWGQLSPKEILNQALKIFDEKLDELNTKI
ncbi:MAG: DNA-directed RNA polymerase subunit D [Candidatus Woesearchaeota archaeon]